MTAFTELNLANNILLIRHHVTCEIKSQHNHEFQIKLT